MAELYHYPRCFGCGSANPRGLRLTGTWDGTAALLRHVPPVDSEGAPGIVHGGYVGALVDEAMALVAAEVAGAPAMTRRVQLDYQAPTIVGRELLLHVTVPRHRGKIITVAVTGGQGDTTCFTAEGTFLQVPIATWGTSMRSAARTTDKLDFAGGDPSTYFRWQLAGFAKSFRTEALARPVAVRLTVTDVAPPSWTLSASAAGLTVVEATGPVDVAATCDFRTWQRLTHETGVVADAVAAGDLTLTGDEPAFGVLVEAIARR